jgi:histidyl-tRNA synthetase
MPPDKIVEPRLLRGFRDYLPGSMNARNAIVSTIRAVYERYGFMPLETPAQEYRVTLLGYGEENTKQIFPIVNPEEEDVALRFDLTAPLARVVAQYPDLPLPFRRYQVGPVWRADKPDPGRFREFLQFDLDTVGSSSLAADLEILCGMHDTLEALGFLRFKIRFSDRKVLNSLLDYTGIPHEAGHRVFRVLDKLEKIGFDNVAAELTRGRVDASGDRISGLGLATAQVNRIREFITIPPGPRSQVLSHLNTLFVSTPSAREGLDEIQFLCDGLAALGIPDDRVALDQNIARGLDYYTGPVFEAILLDAPEFGSIFGGGRYDGLVERFLGRKIPGVGASIGVDRLFAAMQKLGLVDVAPATSEVIVTTMDPSRIMDYLRLTRELRVAGIRAETYLGDERGLGKQLQYANRLRIPFAVIMGSDEFSRDEVTVKNLELGGKLQDAKKSATGKDRDEWLKLSRTVQATVPRSGFIGHIREMVNQRRSSGARTP